MNSSRQPDTDFPTSIKLTQRTAATDDRRQRQRHRVGPDYRSRQVKLRLFGLVCAVMLVLVLMFEARQPKNWEWMGFAPTEPPIDTRYLANLYDAESQPAAPAIANRRDADQQGVEESREPLPQESKSRAETGPEKSEPTSDQAKSGASPSANESGSSRSAQLEMAESDLWKSIYDKLNFRQRMLLLEGLYLARHEKQLEEKQATEWLRMIEELSIANDRYQGDIVKYLGTLPENDRERGNLADTLFQLGERWKRFEKVLLSIGNREPLQPTDRDSLGDFQSLLDDVMLDFVEDNSLQSFATDQPALFRQVEKLRQDVLAGVSPEKVQFTQLYKETDRLRGEPVTFSGTIRGAYSATPTPNYLDLKQLYVFWIQIDGSQNPVAVYALDPPADFVVDLDAHTGQSPAELREKVDVTGILFQKMVYAAQDGQRIAPVILTNHIDWIPEEEPDPAAGELPWLTPMVAIFLAIGGGLAIFTWAFVTFNNRQQSRRIEEFKRRHAEQEESAGEGTGESPGESEERIPPVSE